MLQNFYLSHDQIRQLESDLLYNINICAQQKNKRRLKKLLDTYERFRREAKNDGDEVMAKFWEKITDEIKRHV